MGRSRRRISTKIPLGVNDIRNLTGVETDNFKRLLDKWLLNVPDTPRIDDYGVTVAAESNTMVQSPALTNITSASTGVGNDNDGSPSCNSIVSTPPSVVYALHYLGLPYLFPIFGLCKWTSKRYQQFNVMLKSRDPGTDQKTQFMAKKFEISIKDGYKDRVLIYCHNVEALVSFVLNDRAYDPYDHLVRIGLDGGSFKDTSVRRTIILAAVEGIKTYVHRQNCISCRILKSIYTTKCIRSGQSFLGYGTRQTILSHIPNYLYWEIWVAQFCSYPEDIFMFSHPLVQLDICYNFIVLIPMESTPVYMFIKISKYYIVPLIYNSSSHFSLLFLKLEIQSISKRIFCPILRHFFLLNGVILRSLPSSACTQVPKFGMDVIGKSVSMPEQQLQQSQQIPLPQSQSHHPLNQDIKKITSSVSTLRIPNQKLQSDKISILDGGLGSPINNNHPNSSPHPKEELRKKDSGGTFSSCLRQKLSSVICTNDNKASGGNIVGKKKDISSGTLYNLLATCLDNMPDDMNNNPPLQNHSPLFISKWIDYSNKYGFGYQLCDHSVGVFFNDLTRISINTDKSRVEFTDASGHLTVQQVGTLPAWLQERYQLLRYFATYMEENLTEAGDTRAVRAAHSRTSVIPHVRRWDRTPKSIIMQLSNGTFQINFFKDHTKIVIAGERSDVSVMFISSDRQSFTYRLSQIAELGCDAMIRERLVYALSCLRQYAELDGEEVV
ncbi:unnamed protein product, partial [Meganyctiphanes norvegica]